MDVASLPAVTGCNGEVCLQLESQGEQLQLKVRTLVLDWETEQKRSMSYFNQIMELEKERDQVSVGHWLCTEPGPAAHTVQFVVGCRSSHLSVMQTF